MLRILQTFAATMNSDRLIDIKRSVVFTPVSVPASSSNCSMHSVSGSSSSEKTSTELNVKHSPSVKIRHTLSYSYLRIHFVSHIDTSFVFLVLPTLGHRIIQSVHVKFERAFRTKRTRTL